MKVKTKIESYRIFNVNWETDGQVIDEISDLFVQVEVDASFTKEDLEEILSDHISNETGWLHNGFNYEQVELKKDNSVKKQLKTKEGMKQVVFMTMDEIGNRGRLICTVEQVINVFGDIDSPQIYCYGIGDDAMSANFKFTVKLKQKVDSCIKNGDPFPKGLLNAFKHVYATPIEVVNQDIPDDHSGTYMFATGDECCVYVFINDVGPIATEYYDLTDTLDESGENYDDDELENYDAYDIVYDASKKKLVYTKKLSVIEN